MEMTSRSVNPTEIENPIHLELELPGATDSKHDSANQLAAASSESKDGARAAEEPIAFGRDTLAVDVDGFTGKAERVSAFLEQFQPSAGRRSSISGTNPMAQLATKPSKGLKHTETFRV